MSSIDCFQHIKSFILHFDLAHHEEEMTTHKIWVEARHKIETFREAEHLRGIEGGYLRARGRSGSSSYKSRRHQARTASSTSTSQERGEQVRLHVLGEQVRVLGEQVRLTCTRSPHRPISTWVADSNEASKEVMHPTSARTSGRRQYPQWKDDIEVRTRSYVSLRIVSH